MDTSNYLNNSYVVINIENDHFDLCKGNKPQRETATSLLEKIYLIIRNEMPIDSKSSLAIESKDQIWNSLKESALYIKDNYKKKIDKFSSFGKMLSKNSLETIEDKCAKIDHLVAIKIENFIKPPSAFCTPLSLLIPKFFNNVNTEDLGRLAQLNRAANASAKSAVIERAQSLNYRGNNYLDAANYLINVKESMNYLYNRRFLNEDYLIIKNGQLDSTATLQVYSDLKLPEDSFLKLNPANNTALLTAVLEDQSEVVKTLCGWGINLEIRNVIGNTPLMSCINSLNGVLIDEKKEIKRDIIKTFLRNGADPNAINSTYGVTPLYCLAKGLLWYPGHGQVAYQPLFNFQGLAWPSNLISLEIFDLLLEYGADPFYQNPFDENNTIIHRLVDNLANYEKHRHLILNCKIRNNGGSTPLDVFQCVYIPT
jgi:hypothetical protein